MLTITVPGLRLYDEDANEFIDIRSQTIQLEHSLVSLSKWESKWCKPFLGKENKTNEEILDYIRCMTLTQNVNENTYRALLYNPDILEKIKEYIEAPMTATWFSNEQKGKPNREVVTAELIYYWMIALNIPFECQKWHLNRLLTLIKVCNIKNTPPKKMSKKDIMSRNRALNEARRMKSGSKG